MTAWSTAAPAISAAFLASLVEVVEAFTIVLAVATLRGWRPAALGTAGGLGLLAGIVLLLGPLLDRVPMSSLQLAIGILLLLFGMGWLRKASLRAAGITALKAVLLEGLEVVFILIAVGAGRGLLVPAGLGALAACAVVLAAGAIVHRPLSRVPENILKFGVGVMLSAFGVFWTGEGLGIAWPGADFALLLFAALFLGAGLLASAFARKLAVEFA